MKLYSSATSPFVRKVLVCLQELGIDDQVQKKIAGGTPLDAGTVPVEENPLGKVPILIRDDGHAIYDSRIITRYLNDYADGSLYPDDETLWDVLTIEATAEGMMDAALLMTYEVRVRPEGFQMPDMVEGQWSKIARSLDLIENQWMDHLAGALDASHIALGCALGYIDLRHDTRGWRDGHPQLVAWYANVAERPSMQATAPNV